MWTEAKWRIDQANEKGMYIFTGSIWFKKNNLKDPAIGRFGTIRIYPLNLYESKQSLNLVSLMDLKQNKFEVVSSNQSFFIIDLIKLVCRDGFPNILQQQNFIEQYQQYIDDVISLAVESKLKVNQKYLKLVLKYCATITCSTLSLRQLQKKLKEEDVELYNELEQYFNSENNKLITRQTRYKYTNLLQDLFLIEKLDVFGTNISSARKLVKTSKMYFVDPCLAIGALNLNENKLLNNLNLFGYYFENFVYKELKVYAQYYNANLYYYRDENNLEIDFILQFNDEEFFAIEVKTSMSDEGIKQATKNLLKFKELCLQVQTKTKFNSSRKFAPSKLIIIVGIGGYAYKTKDYVYIIPVNFLKP